MADRRKTLFRYSDESRVSATARSHIPNTSERSEKITLSESDPSSKCGLFSERSTDLHRDGVPEAECEASEKAIKRLNIPFDEVVYQDLISLNGIRMRTKSDEFGRLTDRPRRLKKLDPEPDLMNFFRPTKQEFLFCDLLGKNFDPEGEDTANCQNYHNLMGLECDDRVNNESVPDGDSGSESGKHSSCEEMELVNLDVDTCSIEKFRLLNENYGLDPPQLRSHFEGSSLCKRSQAWKLS